MRRKRPFLITRFYIIEPLFGFVIITLLNENYHMTIQEQELQVYSRLKRLREKAKISQLELSISAGVSQNMIAYIENGKRTPTLKTLLKLCDALHVSPSVLFNDTDNDAEEVREAMHRYIDYYVR